MRGKILRAVGVAIFAGAAAAYGCSSSDEGGAGTTTVRCVQKASSKDGTDEDCTKQGLPRKLDCDNDADHAQAIAAGCKEEEPGDKDVCCPTSVIGGADPSTSALRCYQKAGTKDGDDEDCTKQGLPRKLDCDNAADHQQAIAAGCKEEEPGDNDVCCPTTVTGGTPPGLGGTSSGSTSSGGTSGTSSSGSTPVDAGSDAKAPGLGIAEPCTANAQCRSGICYQPHGGNGWCTTTCSQSFDANCLGDYEGEKDSRGEYVVCMPFGGSGGRCFPGCVTTKCGKYTNLVCHEGVNDIKNYNVHVCEEL